MLTVIKGNDIEYTENDTFDLEVTSDEGFDEGSTLTLIISKNENSLPLINNQYNLGASGGFSVTLSTADKQKLSINNYIYKLILNGADGTVLTQKSGDFIVKWGA